MKGDLPWRTGRKVGRKVGRTLYDAHDELIGVMDTRELAEWVVDSVNGRAVDAILAADPSGVARARAEVAEALEREGPIGDARAHLDGLRDCRSGVAQ